MQQVKATIRIEVIVPVGSWNANSTFDSLYPQVKQEGLTIVKNAVKTLGWKIAGETAVVLISSEYEGDKK